MLLSTTLLMGAVRADALEDGELAGSNNEPVAAQVESSQAAAAEVSAPEPPPAAIEPPPAAIEPPPPAFEPPPAAFEPPPAAFEPPQAAGQSTGLREVGYKELVKKLNACIETGPCEVQRVEFINSSGEKAVAFINGDEYKVLDIPSDNPNNDSSPLRLAAKLRDAKVPYTFPFSAYLKQARESAPPSSSQPAPSAFSFPSLSLPNIPSPF